MMVKRIIFLTPNDYPLDNRIAFAARQNMEDSLGGFVTLESGDREKIIKKILYRPNVIIAAFGDNEILYIQTKYEKDVFREKMKTATSAYEAFLSCFKKEKS